MSIARATLLPAALCLGLAASAGAQHERATRGSDAPTRRVEGRVLDSSGWPLAGARVFVLRRAENEPATGPARPLFETATDGDGRFTFDALDSGGYQIDIEAPDHQAAHVGLHLPDSPVRVAPLEVNLWPVTTRPVTAPDPSPGSGTLPSTGATREAPTPGPGPVPDTTPSRPSADRETPVADTREQRARGSAVPERPEHDGSEVARDAAVDPESEPGLTTARTHDLETPPSLPARSESLLPRPFATPSGLAIEVTAALDAGQLSRARSLLEQVEGAHPSDADLFYSVGEALVRSGEPEEAVAVLDEALARDPAHADARYRRALALLAMGRREDARAEFERVLAHGESGPLAERARTALAELGAGGDAP